MTIVMLAFALGRPLPAINVFDDAGRLRSTDAWKGVPTILVPMYTRCPLACPMIVAGMKRGTADARARADSYRVVLFSFDPRDTPADLRAFRERHGVPLAWTVASAGAADIHRLMEAIDVPVADANGTLMHPNVVVALTPDLKPAKVLVGTSFDIDAALSIARGERDWVGQYGAYALAALILIATLAAIYAVAALRASP